MRRPSIGGDVLLGPVDAGHAILQHQFDQFVAGVVIARQAHQGAVPVFGVAGEPDPVVGRVGLLGHHRHPPLATVVATSQRLDEPVTDHAMANDHDVS